MSKKIIRNLNLKDAIIRTSKTSLNFMGNDLLLFNDFQKVPIPKGAFKMDCTFAVICSRGYAKFALNTIEQRIDQNALILINKNEIVESRGVSKDFNGVTIFISKDFMEDIIMNYEDISSLLLFSREHPIVHLTQENMRTFYEFYHLVEGRLYDASNHFRKEIVRNILLSWIYELSGIIYTKQQGLESNKKRGEIIFAKFLKIVEQSYKTEKRVSWYAEQLCISPKYLSTMIKNVSQRSPNEWIDYYVILEAKVLLKNTSLTIHEISKEIGFPNQSFFGKFFKERVGLSPLSYRRNN